MSEEQHRDMIFCMFISVRAVIYILKKGYILKTQFKPNHEELIYGQKFIITVVKPLNIALWEGRSNWKTGDKPINFTC